MRDTIKGGQMPGELYELLREVRADYVATMRDNWGRKNHVLPLDLSRLPLLTRLDEAINDLGIICGEVEIEITQPI